MNNYERIKAMDIEEMVEFILDVKDSCIFMPDIYCNPYNKNNCYLCLKKHVKQWLQADFNGCETPESEG